MLRTERMQIERERDLNRGEIMFRGGLELCVTSNGDM